MPVTQTVDSDRRLVIWLSLATLVAALIAAFAAWLALSQARDSAASGISLADQVSDACVDDMVRGEMRTICARAGMIADSAPFEPTPPATCAVRANSR